MTAQEIITLFETLIDDSSDLSLQEKLDLLNRKYQEVNTARTWAYLLKSYSATATAGVVSLPSDFGYFVPKIDPYTHQNMGIALGSTRDPVNVVNFSDRFNPGRNAYIDVANEDIVFSDVTIADTVQFDYISAPDGLALNDRPVFPHRFHQLLAYMMAAEGFDIQLFDKGRSYSTENERKAARILSNMILWDAQFVDLI